MDKSYCVTGSFNVFLCVLNVILPNKKSVYFLNKYIILFIYLYDCENEFQTSREFKCVTCMIVVQL